MPDQAITPLPDGSVELAADVNGLMEAVNWVLSWGSHAEAVSPPEFRSLVAEHVRRAAARYAPVNGTPGGVRKASIPRGSNPDKTTGKTKPRRGASREVGRGGVRVAG
jgi:hypothetical protein